MDGLGQVIHERLFAVEIAEDGEPRLQEPGLLGNFAPADPPAEMPAVATLPEATTWLHEHALAPFLEETRKDRLAEVERVSAHVELSLTELLQRADEEIGRAASDVEQKLPGAEGRLAQAETRHAELLARRERRRIDLERQRALTLQAVERLASVLVLPHPEREAPEVRRLKPNFETEAIAMRVVMEHERAQGRQVYDVSEKNLGYDVTSLDLASGELRLIEVKGLGAATGTILLTPNERRVAEDRRDCFWLYVVTDCDNAPRLQEPIRDPARLDWNEVTKVAHYYLSVNAMTKPMQVREDSPPYGKWRRTLLSPMRGTVIEADRDPMVQAVAERIDDCRSRTRAERVPEAIHREDLGPVRSPRRESEPSARPPPAEPRTVCPQSLRTPDYPEQHQNSS